MTNKGFDLDAMRAALGQCDKNIAVFEQAIAKEQATKAEYARIIRYLEDQAANPPRVRLEVVKED